MIGASVKRVDAVGIGSAGSPFFWQLYFDPTNVGVTAQECSDWVKDFFFAARAHFSSGLTITNDAEVKTIDIATGDITNVEIATVFPVGGTATDLLPLQTQGLIQWRTLLFVAGRRLQGRTFLPTPPEADNDGDGTPSTGYATAWTASVTAANTAHPTVVHGIYSRTHRVAAAAPTGTVPNQWSYLRSRRD